jgi:CheY-like chemotaxis protein
MLTAATSSDKAPLAVAASRHKESFAADELPGPILIVEDDFMLRGSLDQLLRTVGYRVECAANALDALRRLERPPKPSLILLDIMLPYMDGLEFRAVQRRTHKIADIPVIVITAVGMRPDIQEDLNLREMFFKPIDLPKLLAAIRRCCPSGQR